MTRGTRGAALPETAILLSMVLMVLLAAVQLSVIGFSQATADGAAFVAAHTEAVNASADGSAVARSIFPAVGRDVTVTNGASTTTAVASLTAGGLLLLPGAPSSYVISGGDVEPTFAGGSGNGTFDFGASATLPNYCPAGPQGARCDPTYQIYLAQRLDSDGNGINGQFKEWTCHLNAYQGVPFPSSIGATGYVNPTTQGVGISGTDFDYSKSSTSEGKIYSADSGKQHDGMNC